MGLQKKKPESGLSLLQGLAILTVIAIFLSGLYT